MEVKLLGGKQQRLVRTPQTSEPATLAGSVLPPPASRSGGAGVGVSCSIGLL